MFKRFVSLQWKSFFRSSSFGKSLAIKILMGFFAVYMLFSLVGGGIVLYALLRKIFPDQNPMWMLSRFLIYWILIELFFSLFHAKITSNGH